MALVLGFAATGVRAASDSEIIRDVFYSFSNGEQRLIRTMTAHPSDSGKFQGGLQKILDAKSDPARFAAEKERFQLEWRGTVSSWASGYSSGDKTITGQMSSIPKPSRKEFSAAAPWMAKIDQDSFSGGLYDGVIGKMNPYEAAYSIAGLQGLSKKKAAETEQKLKDNSSYPTRLVAGFILDDTRKKFQGDLKDVQTAYARDKSKIAAKSKTLLAQLKAMKAAGVDADFDGSVKKKPGSTPVVVASGEKPTVPEIGKGKEVPVDGKKEKPKEGELKKAPVDSGEKDTFRIKEPPSPQVAAKKPNLFASLSNLAPKTDDDAFASRKGSSGAGIGTMIKEVFKKPAVAMGTGALLGGLIGFLFGGPIGAAIGAVIGAAAGGVTASKLKD